MIDFHMPRIIGTPILPVNRQTDFRSYQNSDMDIETPNTLGKRLKACRKDAKLTQAAVSQRVGIKQGSLSELENDKYPTSSFVPHLANLYKVEAMWLAEGRGPKRRANTPSLPIPEVSQPATPHSGIEYAHIKEAVTGVLRAFNLNYSDLVSDEAAAHAAISDKLLLSSNTNESLNQAKLQHDDHIIPKSLRGECDDSAKPDKKGSPHERAKGEQ